MAVPAGWYPDGQGHQRWWDGERWTAHIGPLETTLAPVQPGDIASEPGEIDVPLLAPETESPQFSLGPVEPDVPVADAGVAVPALEPERVGGEAEPVRSIPLAPAPSRRIAPQPRLGGDIPAAPGQSGGAASSGAGSGPGDGRTAGARIGALRRSPWVLVAAAGVVLVAVVAGVWWVNARGTSVGASSAEAAVLGLLESSAMGDCERAASFSLEVTAQDAGLCFPEVQSSGVMYQVVDASVDQDAATVTVLASGGLLGADGLDVTYGAVKRDGRWFVDLSAKADAQGGGTDTGAGEPGGETTDATAAATAAPQGASTPEGAVASFIDAAWVNGDCAAAFATLDPAFAPDQGAFCASFEAEGGLRGAASGASSATDAASVAGEYAAVTGYVVDAGGARTPFQFELVNQGGGWLIYYVTAAQ